MKRAALALLTFLYPDAHFGERVTVQAVDFHQVSGTAVAEPDGTLNLANMRLELAGTEPPAGGQCCVQDAKNVSCGVIAAKDLNAFLAGKTLSCQITSIDIRKHRPRAICGLPDGGSLNNLVVLAGYAAAAQNADATIQQSQSTARATKRGLWAQDFIAPADWRQTQMAGSNPLSCQIGVTPNN